MGIAQGYGRAAGSNGLVFAYDTGDTRNSYIGEPTTNLINPASLNIYSWWTRAVQTLETLPNETYYGMPIYRLSLSLDTDEQRDYARSSGGAGTAWYAQYLTYQANTAYIASAIYRPVSHSDMTVKGHPSNIGGWGLNYNDSIDLANGWKRHRIDRNYGAVASDNKFYHLWAPSANTGDVLVIDITANQIEQKNHLTPFVNGTRSDTQGLLDLRGNSSMSLQGVSFNSNSQILFDGTDDYIELAAASWNILTTHSLEAVFKPTGTPSGGYHVLFQKEGGYSGGAVYGLRANDLGQIFAMICYDNQAASQNTLGSTISITNGTWYHVVATFDSSYSWKLYVNGELHNSTTLSGNPYQNSSAITIGQGDGRKTNGELPVMKIYNRVLSAAEILNNYRNYKTRFGI